jgi:hypothetical protein
MQRHVNQALEAAEVMDPSAVSGQIDRILHSQTFVNKSQLRKLLEILRRNMASQTELKPSGVIQELWPEEIRTKRAADVATEMNRLRRALQSYYDEEGKADPITISLPNRSVPTADGAPEKRWIAATLRAGIEDQPPSPEANAGRGLKKIALVAALGAVGIVAYVSIRILTVHDEPKLGRLDGSALVIMNADGKELWRKTFPEGFGPDGYYPKDLASRIWFGYLDGSAHTSVLFVYSRAGSAMSSASSTLICYSDRGKEEWSWTPGRELPELEGTPTTYRIFALGVLKASDQRPPRIVVSSAHAIWWPSQIAVLDSNGKVTSEYWHSGHLDYVVLGDLDGDGKEEIVAAGVNNDYRQATLVVLDPDRVFGASAEVRPNFQIHGMGDAQERLRLLFPRSDVNRALFSYNIATDPSVVNGRIRLTVWECVTPTPGCTIWYEFDKNTHLISAYAGEDFRSRHVEFYRSGKDAHALSNEEELEFRKVRCLVGCKSEFVPVGTSGP